MAGFSTVDRFRGNRQQNLDAMSLPVLPTPSGIFGQCRRSVTGGAPRGLRLQVPSNHRHVLGIDAPVEHRRIEPRAAVDFDPRAAILARGQADRDDLARAIHGQGRLGQDLPRRGFLGPELAALRQLPERGPTAPAGLVRVAIKLDAASRLDPAESDLDTPSQTADGIADKQHQNYRDGRSENASDHDCRDKEEVLDEANTGIAINHGDGERNEDDTHDAGSYDLQHHASAPGEPARSGFPYRKVPFQEFYEPCSQVLFHFLAPESRALSRGAHWAQFGENLYHRDNKVQRVSRSIAMSLAAPGFWL